MLYEFKSKAGGTVVMTQPTAEQLLGIIGKAPAPAGVFEPTHLPEAVRKLQAAVDAEAPPTPEDDDAHEAVAPMARPVSLRQRAWPLMDLFKAAIAARQRVTWGV